MKIFFNGKAEEVDTSTNLEEFVREMVDVENFAIALNENFVPKSLYKHTQLKRGDRIECVTAVQGG